MKSVGATRKIDNLGRLVIPMEIRRNLGWTGEEIIEIGQLGDYVLLKGSNDSFLLTETTPTTPLAQKFLDTLNRINDSDMVMLLTLAYRLAN